MSPFPLRAPVRRRRGGCAALCEGGNSRRISWRSRWDYGGKGRRRPGASFQKTGTGMRPGGSLNFLPRKDPECSFPGGGGQFFGERWCGE
ncbi:hypothetical protein C1H46_034563 [Malus baccata]|uniref:Uncharacterized protein n=1 Tax=Malus baccata TaxID=106549 RepID=A0A540L0N0_MALBA|nr:hypothetical protein C1H46_034563 [Malus baccata]